MISIYNSKALREEKAEKADELEALVALAEEDQRDFTDDEQTMFDGLMAEVEAYDGKIEQAERYEKIKAAQVNRLPAAISKPVDEPKGAVIRIKPRRLKAFRGENAHQDAYDCAQWYLATVGRNESAQEYCNAKGIETRWQTDRGEFMDQQTITPGSAGGFTVPSPLSSAIIDVMEEYGVVYQICRIFPMTANTLDVPKRVSGPAVQYPGEATAITETAKVWSQVNLVTKKRAVLTKASNELIADSIINVIDDLAMDAGRMIGLQADDEFINGDGTATYGGETGVDNAIDAANRNTGAGNTWAALTLQDFTDTMGLLPDRFHAGSCWVVSRQFYAAVMERLLYAAGGTTSSLVEAGPGRTMFMGYPVYFTEKMPAEGANTLAALFGQFYESVAVGLRQDVSVAISDQYAFNEDVTTVRTITRDNIVVHETAAGGGIVALDTAT